MADYLPPLARRSRNFIFTRDGNVWVNYLLTGTDIDMYEPTTVESAQRSHAILFESLSRIDSDDFYLAGLLAPVSHDERMNRIVAGLPKFTTAEYPELHATLRAHSAAIKSGRIPEFQRVYWLAARMPTKMSFVARMSSMLFETNPFEGVTSRELNEFDEKLRAAIPAEFDPRPTTPEHLDWAFDRARLRGLSVPPMLPNHPNGRTVSPGPRSFPQVHIEPNADGDALVEDFARKYDSGKDVARKSLREYFSSLMKGQCIAVRNPDQRTADLPDGPVSYQSVMGISGYATQFDYAVRGLMSAVDLANGLDADFAVRFRFVPDGADTNVLNETLKNLDVEDTSNSDSVLDAADYDDRRSEVHRYHADVRGDTNPVAMDVTTLFSFASLRLDTLVERTRAADKLFTDAGYRVFRPVGGQDELWKMMLPGSATTSLGEDLYGRTTAKRFGAYAPLRRVGVGDGAGVPLGQCIENALGTEVYFDLLRATERGNASIAFTGAQGRGKSHAAKQIVSWMNDMRMTSYILDGQGEWATFVEKFDSHQVVNLVEPSVSIDPIKMCGTYREAATMLQQLILPMLGVRPDSAAGSEVVKYLSAEYLSARSIPSTRVLLERIVNDRRYDLREVLPAIRTMLRDTMMGAFIDPEVNGRIVNLPPAQLTARNVVFYTFGLPLPTEGKSVGDMTLPERYTIMANTAVALLTASRFNQIRSVCEFVLDEASFFEGLDVLTPLIKTPDRTGRKFGNFVLVASQTGAELSKPEYKLVRRRFCMGQDREANSAEALEWAGFLASDALVHDLTHNTSPLSVHRGNMPEPGREGEAFLNDGTRKAKVRVYPVFRDDRSAAADTTSSRFVRYDLQEDPA